MSKKEPSDHFEKAFDQFSKGLTKVFDDLHVKIWEVFHPMESHDTCPYCGTEKKDA